MPEITCFSGCTDWLHSDFVERERTPPRLMKLGICLHLSGLSLSNTISIREEFGVERSRKAVHDWVQKADLQPASDSVPNQIALDETVIRVDDEPFWLYAAVDPAANYLLHIRLFPGRPIAMTGIVFRELRQKHDVDDALFLVDGAPWLQTALDRHGLDLRYERMAIRTPSNISIVW